jgi:glyoxylase-like metal-dependent hydrolase (beta-lactamase superfamily II)
MFQLGSLRLELISDGFFELSSSSFVQVGQGESKASAHRIRPKPRIKVGFNSLLIRSEGRTVLIDPGTGDKPRADKVLQYKMEWPRRVYPTLIALGIQREDIDTVILTHLHWDHCGGATCTGRDGKIVPVFPRARYFVQERELVAARASADPDSYLPEDFEPLAEAGVLDVVNGEVELFPDLNLRWTGGHSAGHQIVIIGKCDAPRAVFLSDLIPTSAQIPLDQAMSYDEKAEELRVAKQRILAEAAEHHHLLTFVHAPRVRAGYVKTSSQGAIDFQAVEI